MLRRISIYVCTIFLFMGASVTDARGVALYRAENHAPEDTLAQESESSRERVADEIASGATSLDFDPFDYRVQSRHREYGEVYRNDSAYWLQHTTLGLFGGAFFQGNNGTGNQSGIRPVDHGRSLGVSLRYEWSPLHGIRFAFQGSRYKDTPFNYGPVKTREIMLGYTFNLTNYFKGYDPNKRFHVSAAAGVVGARVTNQDEKDLAARAEMSLIFDYRFAHNWSFFAEPYVGISTDNYDLYTQHHGFDYVGGLRGGVLLNGNAFRDLYLQMKAKQNDLYAPKAWFQRFYFGSTAGRMFSDAHTLDGLNKRYADSHIHVGYNFNPVSSLRLMATYFKTPEGLERKHHVMGELDYVLDFRSLRYGYDPQKHWRTKGFFGVGARYLDAYGANTSIIDQKQYTDRIAPYATLGLNVHYYLTPQLSFYAEPWAAAAVPVYDGQKSTLFGGLRAGFQVDLIDTYIYLPRYAVTDQEKTIAGEWRRRPLSHVFFGASGGIMEVHKQDGYFSNPSDHRVMPFNVFLGYRLTPIQAFRVQASYIKSDSESLLNPRKKHVMGQVDYMVNFSNLLYGYKPKRIFNFTGYVGLGVKYIEPSVIGDDAKRGATADYYNKDTESVRLAPMFTSGADLSFRIHNGVSLFVEPWAGLLYGKGQRFYTFTYGANGGLAINLDDAYLYGPRVQGTPSPLWKNNFLRHFFIGGGGGIAGNHTDASKSGDVLGHDHYNHLTMPTTMFVGYHFSPNQSLRARGGYVKTFEEKYRDRHLQGTVEYMLNLTNALFGYKPDRRLNMFGFAGLGANFLTTEHSYGDGYRHSRLSPMADMGFDVTVRIKNGLSAYVEPILAVTKNKSDDFYTMHYGANVGLALDFDPLYAYRPVFGEPTDKWNQKNTEKVFFGGSIGWMRIQRQYNKDLIPATMLVGYRFSPIHALRARVNYNKATGLDKTRQRYHVSGSVDYMFNFTNMLSAYNPNRRVNFIGFLGLGVRSVETNSTDPTNYVRYGEDGHVRMQGNAGLDVAYSITRNVHVFVEPYVGAVRAGNKHDFMDFNMGVNGGFVVSMLDFYKPWGNEKIKFNHGPFYEATLGYMFPRNSGSVNHMAGLSLDGRAGFWIDPVLGMRGSFIAENYYYANHYPTIADSESGQSDGYSGAMVLKFRLEGLFNPLNLTEKGRAKDTKRKFDINLAAGVEFGGAGKKFADGYNPKEQMYAKGQEVYGLYGITAAAQLLYNATPACALYIEPRYEYMNAWYLNKGSEHFVGNVNDNIVTLNAGVRITRPTAEITKNERPISALPRLPWMFAVSAGGYRAINGYKPENGGRVAKSFTLNFGYRFNNIHAVKLQFEPSFYKTKYEGYKYTLLDYRLLYMCNVTNAYQKEKDRKVNVYGELGAVASTIVKHPSEAELASKNAFGLAGGFLVGYNFNKHIALTVEPLGQFVFKKNYLPGFGFRPHMKQMRVDLSAGLMYIF